MATCVATKIIAVDLNLLVDLKNDAGLFAMVFQTIERNLIMINEVSTSRLLKHLTDNNKLAIISTYRDSRTESQNRSLLRKLKTEVRNLGYGFTELISKWVEQQDGQTYSSDERSLMIYNITLDQAEKLGEQYNQSSIIYKDADKCAEVCTCEFTDYEGKLHKPGQCVRYFNVKNTKSPMGLDDAREIFANRKGGPASKPVKSNRPFKLSEMYEVESPKGSVFSTAEKYIRLI